MSTRPCVCLSMSKTKQRGFTKVPVLLFFTCSDRLIAWSLADLDWPLQLRLLITEPHHPDDRHGDAEPVEEAEEVYDGEDVVGEGVEQRHQTLVRGRERSN